jgi:septum formation protein
VQKVTSFALPGPFPGLTTEIPPLIQTALPILIPKPVDEAMPKAAPKKYPHVGIVLASASTARKALLNSAGLMFDVIVPPFDEETAKKAFGKISSTRLAMELAKAKALTQSHLSPHNLVIGADQVLSLNGRIFSKAKNMTEAREALLALRGKTHELTSAVACAAAGKVIWLHHAKARLKMRNFTSTFLEAYLHKNSEQILHAVGCYQVEGPGIQLFEKITGDSSTIMGLPLLPLLKFLRQEGHLPS